MSGCYFVNCIIVILIRMAEEKSICILLHQLTIQEQLKSESLLRLWRTGAEVHGFDSKDGDLNVRPCFINNYAILIILILPANSVPSKAK